MNQAPLASAADLYAELQSALAGHQHLLIGKALYNIRATRAYLELGFFSFRKFVESEDIFISYSKAVVVLQAYARLVLGLGLDMERLLRIPFSKLRAISPVVGKDVAFWLGKAESSIPYARLEKEASAALGVSAKYQPVLEAPVYCPSCGQPAMLRGLSLRKP